MCMPRQDIDRNTTWLLEMPDQTWTLSRHATLAVDDGWAISESTSNSTVRILGAVRATDDGGVYLFDLQSKLIVGASGVVDAWDSGESAIRLANAGIDMTNRGVIACDYVGVRGVGGGKVENYGMIHADYAVRYDHDLHLENFGSIKGYTAVGTDADGTMILNGRGGEIVGYNIGIDVYEGNDAKIINHGIIHGGSAAIHSEGEINIVNRGRIVGDLELSDGADKVDTRNGQIRGVIFGGEGDDLYLISSSFIRIDDRGASFADEVISSATYTLVGGLDLLTLTGKKDIDGTGNAGDNDILGNAGDNRLSGMDGGDILHGGRGSDVMIGGAGQDQFVFQKGDGVDIVQDFLDGVDGLFSRSIDSVGDFDRLNIRQLRDDVVIDFGHGDRLILRDTSKADISYDDFAA